jgi:altronate hydrolase
MSGVVMTGAGAVPQVLVLHHGDDVAVATADLAAGVAVDAAGEAVVTAQAIPRGHKVALRAVASGQPVHKYGQIIGFATVDVRPGDHVHTHNMEFRNFAHTPGTAQGAGPDPFTLLPAEQRATFQGIVRPDGRVATRNYLGILTSVNCSATAARMIAREIVSSGALAGYPGVDGVVAFTHTSGCGMDHDGEGLATLRRTIAGYARHPNFAGILLLGLGCEANQVDELAAEWDIPSSTPVEVMTIQGSGGTRATVAAATERLQAMLPYAAKATRQTVSAAELVLGLQCGGSDAFSGLTANPALGVASDLLVRNGGTAILGETPEIYGAEHLLLSRAVRPEVAKRLEERIRWWEGYTAANGGSMDNNPSPGNKVGGLSTILEKSLGAVAKGGKSPLVEVYGYAEDVKAKGFVFMDTPGYDPVSVTGMVAGGANIVCFTTGRGSAFGAKPVPSLKLATTSVLYRHMTDDMDLNCGAVLDGEVDLAQMGQRIFDAMLVTASGQPTKSEEIGVGDEEFAPWQLGAVM